MDAFILVYGAFLAFLEETTGMAAVGVGDFFWRLDCCRFIKQLKDSF